MRSPQPLPHTIGLILAAGKGTRMKSEQPKVLHEVDGVPMVTRVLEALRGAGIIRHVVVVGHEADRVKAVVGPDADYVVQADQWGTAHAVLQARDLLKDFRGDLLVINGDTPLIRSDTLRALVEAKRTLRADAVLLTAEVDDPTGYGRMVRSAEGWVVKIVEEAEATAEERTIREINAGVYLLATAGLFEALAGIPKSPRKGEYYLTDLIHRWSSQGRRIGAVVADDPLETLGVDTQERLALATRVVREQR